MAQKIVQETEKVLLALLQAKGIRVMRIILFGSVSSGRKKLCGDIDLMVVSEDFDGQDIFRRSAKTRGIHRELVRRFRVPFDILYYSRTEWEEAQSLLVQTAKTYGKVIYQA